MGEAGLFAVWFLCGFVAMGVLLARSWWIGNSLRVVDAAGLLIGTLCGPVTALLIGWVVIIEQHPSGVLIKGRRSALNQTKQGQ